MNPIYVDVPEARHPADPGPTQRAGDGVCSARTAATSVAFREFALDLPPKLKIGLSAGNISAKPFTANFENFAVLNDVTKIDEEFGEPEQK